MNSSSPSGTAVEGRGPVRMMRPMLAWAVFGFFLAAYIALPVARQLGAWMRLSTACLLVIVVWEVLSRLGAFPSRAERSFWRTLAWAALAWLAGDLLLLVFAAAPSNLVQVGAEFGFALYYAFFVLALERQPHRPETFDLIRRFALPALSFFILGLFVYFLVLPTLLGTWGEEGYSAAGVYGLVDAFVVLRAAFLWRSTTRRRWRRTYGRLCGYGALMVSGDLFYAVDAELANIAFSLAMVLLVHTAARKSGAGRPVAEEPANETLGAVRHPSWQTLAYAMAFPALHLSLERLDLLADGASVWRADLVLLWTLLLGAIAIVQHRTLESSRIELVRGNRELSNELAERHRLLEKRIATIADLEAKTAELKSFAYTVSHDLKSPLIAIQGFLGLLERDLGDERPETTDKLRHIHNAAQKMAGLIDHLLAGARGRRAMSSGLVSLKRVADEAVELLAGRIAERRVEVIVTPDLPTVVGDSQQLMRLWQNLIDNAIKYMGPQPEPRIEIGARPGVPPVFYVRDNGRGIDPRDHARVFGLFSRATSSADGSGVGLALVQSIVTEHGGRIWIESPGCGHGTTMCFTLAEETAQLPS